MCRHLWVKRSLFTHTEQAVLFGGRFGRVLSRLLSLVLGCLARRAGVVNEQSNHKTEHCMHFVQAAVYTFCTGYVILRC